MALQTTDVRAITATLANGNRFEVVGYRVDTPTGSTAITLFPQVVRLEGETRAEVVRLPDLTLSQDATDALMADAGARYEAYRAGGAPAVLALYASHRDAIYAYLQSHGTFPADAVSVT